MGRADAEPSLCRCLPGAMAQKLSHQDVPESAGSHPVKRGNGPAAGDPALGNDWRSGNYNERLRHSLLTGTDAFIAEDIADALAGLGTPADVLRGPLMEGMRHASAEFEAGKIYLPQLLGAARVMKKASACLSSLSAKSVDERENDHELPPHNGTVLMTTVRGDVRDIGKAIVSIVLECNNFRVVDLGVAVPCEEILDRAVQERADIIGLSGFIAPSLEEMVHVAERMQARGMSVPLLIGGATTSKRHTATSLAPKYDHCCVHVLDAARVCTVVTALLGQDRESFLEDVREEYAEVVAEHRSTWTGKEWRTIGDARDLRPSVDWGMVPPRPNFVGNYVVDDVSIAEIRTFIDWTVMFQVYKLNGKYPNHEYPGILNDDRVGGEARALLEESERMLDWIESENVLQALGVVGIHPANSIGDDIEVYATEDRTDPKCKFYGLRQQHVIGETTYWCLSDFVAPKGAVGDYIAAYACTGGVGCREHRAKFEAAGDIDKAIMLEVLADRLTAAFAELLHQKIRKQVWGYVPDEALDLASLINMRYQGIRPAPGNPSQPDHREKLTMWDLLDVDRLSDGRLGLTESFMTSPASSTCALVFAHPEAKYFSLGPVGHDQVASYAQRRGEDVQETERWLGSTVLGYDRS